MHLSIYINHSSKVTLLTIAAKNIKIKMSITKIIDILIAIFSSVVIYKGVGYFLATSGFVQGSEFGMLISLVGEIALFLVLYGLVQLKDCVEVIFNALQSFTKTP